MAVLRCIIVLCLFGHLVQSKTHGKREIINICDQTPHVTKKVQCFCAADVKNTEIIRSADCNIVVANIPNDDPSWRVFDKLKDTPRISFASLNEIAMTYIPTAALAYTESVTKLEIKYGNIPTVHSFAFANLSEVLEITLRDNQIQTLEKNAFVHHKSLEIISLDKNNLLEINRDVFVNLPSLKKLFLTNNRITTIHDKAFIHLNNLKELEIDRNSIFSLNSESFSGLANLQILDLSSNNLEVIGDNTFLPLSDLKSLNLQENKIQMLDEKAFNGLSKMQSLSLAHNKLTTIENVRTFEGLVSLLSLNLRDNQIRELKPEVMAPILPNFYRSVSSFDIEGNSFPCDCRLDWFISLKNKTLNKFMQLSLENFKCNPSAELRELWSKPDDKIFEEEAVDQNDGDQYYDESELNGKLFYIDVRYLLNCTDSLVPLSQGSIEIPPSTIANSLQMNTNNNRENKVSDIILNTPTQSSETVKTTKKYAVTNHGLLDLSSHNYEKDLPETSEKNDIQLKDKKVGKKQFPVTTSRLATVSEKPIDKEFDHDMAADEAKPEKPNKMIHEPIKEHSRPNSSAGCSIISLPYSLALLISLRLLF